MKKKANDPSLHGKSDLALERRRRDPKEEGVFYKETVLWGIRFTALTVTGECDLPKGKTLSISLPDGLAWSESERKHLLNALRQALRVFFPTPCARLLVAGLGNRRLTADALGPKVAELVEVSALLPEAVLPRGFTRVAVCIPDVLSQTGIESVSTVAAAAKIHRADALLTVDALAARDRERLFRVIEITDTGTVPGGGVKRGKLSLSREKLGIPVVSIGVPTVVRVGEEHFLVVRGMEEELDTLSPLIAAAIDLHFSGSPLREEKAISSLFDAE